MMFTAGRASRREAIARVGALALGAGLSAPVAIAQAPGPQETGLRVLRIGVAVASPDKVDAAAREWLGSSCAFVRASSPSSRIRSISAGLDGIDVEFHAPDFEDGLAGEAFHAASLSGHLIELEAAEPDWIAARSRALGIRLFRDQTVRGQRLIQLDPERLGVRFQIIERKAAAKPRALSGGAQVKGLLVACEDPARAALLAGAAFDLRVTRNMVHLPGCEVTFVQRKAGNGAQGLARIQRATS